MEEVALLDSKGSMEAIFFHSDCVDERKSMVIRGKREKHRRYIKSNVLFSTLFSAEIYGTPRSSLPLLKSGFSAALFHVQLCGAAVTL